VNLTIQDLKKFFGTHLTVHCDSCTCTAGDLVLLTGSNGAGKTTFLRMLGDLLSCDSGSCSSDIELRKAYYEAQFFQFGELTVSEHFSLLEKLVPGASREPFSDVMGLERFAESKVFTLSRGWKNRLGIALAFARKPNLLLLDEPLQALDEEGRRLFFHLLEDFQRHSEGIALIATHYRECYRDLVTAGLHFEAGHQVAFSRKEDA
jgi:ABC-type multidrug transport system ATPase subunit